MFDDIYSGIGVNWDDNLWVLSQYLRSDLGSGIFYREWLDDSSIGSISGNTCYLWKYEDQIVIKYRYEDNKKTILSRDDFENIINKWIELNKKKPKVIIYLIQDY